MGSLLDRALISQSINPNKTITEQEVIRSLNELIGDGLDAKNFLNDVLEVLYLFSRRINLGPIEKDLSISETEVEMVDKYSKNIDKQDISLFWQLTIKTIDDLRIVSNENLTLEMYIIQLVHLKSLGVEEKYSDRNEQEILSRENYSNEKTEEKNIETKLSN